MKKNKWRLAFWICFVVLIAIGLFGFYQIVDQGVTITYMKEGYTDTEDDLETIIELVNTTDLTKNEIRVKLKKHKLNEFMDFKTDTIGLERVLLIFENDRLKKIEKEW